MGASNTFRVMGPVYGIVVLVIDMAKGFLAVQLASYLEVSGEWYTDQSLWQLLLGLMSVIGHVFPLFAGFRGGKGVATLFGVVLAIQPWTALLSVLAFLIVVLLTRYISLGSLTGMIVFAACMWFAWTDTNVYLRWFSLLSAILVLYLHRSNIRRLVKGTENKIQWKKNRRKPK
jgi:glycerol-3-phosphate acyltransferase PlsY